MFSSQSQPQSHFVESDWDVLGWIGVRLAEANTLSAVQTELVGSLLYMAILANHLCDDYRVFDLKGDQPFEMLVAFLCSSLSLIR